MISSGTPLGALIGISSGSEREFPASGITMHIIKERVRRGDSFVFVSYESEIDINKYKDILCPNDQ